MGIAKNLVSLAGSPGDDFWARHRKSMLLPPLAGIAAACLVRAAVTTFLGDWFALSISLVYAACAGGPVWVATVYGRFPVWVVEVLGVVMVVLVCVHDILSYGQLEVNWWALLIMDAITLCGARSTVKVAVQTIYTFFILLSVAEETWDIGLYRAAHSTLDFQGYSPQDPRGVAWGATVLVLHLSIFFLNCMVVDYITSQFVTLTSVIDVVARDLAQFDVDAVEQRFLAMGHPEAITVTFRPLISTIKLYRPYLPDLEAGDEATISCKVAVLKVQSVQPQDESPSVMKEFLSTVCSAARSWQGLVNSFDASSALVTFGVENAFTKSTVEGKWIGASLSEYFVIERAPARGGMDIKVVYRNEVCEGLMETSCGKVRWGGADIEVQWRVTLSNGWFGWLCVPEGDVLDLFLDDGNGMQLIKGDRAVRTESATVLAACGCALGIRDMLLENAAGDVRMAVVWEMADICYFGSAARRSLQVTGQCIDRVQHIAGLNDQLETILLCNQAAAEMVKDVLLVREAHAGPVEDGPVFEVYGEEQVARLRREEKALLEKLPHNRRIEMQELHPEKWVQIGHGSMGRVWLAHYDKVHDNVAVKELLSEEGNERQQLAKKVGFLKELLNLSDLRFNHIVNFYGWSSGKNNELFIVMEYCSLGFLRRHITAPSLSDQERCTIAITMGMSIAHALLYIHGKKKVHRDIASRNILVTADRQYRLADVGLIANVDAVVSTICIPWAAPEALQAQRPRRAKYSHDIWAFGMLCYEVLSGKAPYEPLMTEGMDAVAKAICDGMLPEEPPCVHRHALCRRLWEKVVLPCWRQDPDQRPSMWEMVDITRELHAELAGSITRMHSDPVTSSSSSSPSSSSYDTLGRYEYGKLYLSDYSFYYGGSPKYKYKEAGQEKPGNG